jgi:hypothetical protein
MSWTNSPPPRHRAPGPPIQRPVIKPPIPKDDEGGLLRPLVGKPVVIVLTSGTEWRGTLRQISKFEMEIELVGGARLILMKGAIGSIAEEKP